MSEYVIPERGEALRVGRAILDAHGQWEKENNCAGSQHPWQEPHVILLGQAAMLALSAPAPSQGAGVEPLSNPQEFEAEIIWLREAARYFAARPTGGEDRAHWANVYNAENATRLADRLALLEPRP